MKLLDVIRQAMSKQDNTLEIVSTQQISKNIKRIVFLDNSQKLSSQNESGYIKLPFLDAHGKQILRSYTIREVNDAQHHVVIDFVSHTNDETGFRKNRGLASNWIAQASVGDSLAYMGPGANKSVNHDADWFLFAGDMTALPAIAVNLKHLPSDAKGYAIIEIGDESDKQELDKPDDVSIDWVINTDAKHSVKKMLNAVKEKAWFNGEPYVWVASEFTSAKTLRDYFKQKEHNRKQRYVSSYWKLGETDEGNKQAKAQDGGF